MLICQNCFTENPDGTVRCVHCQMEGKFAYKVPGGIKPEGLQLDEDMIQCINCGENPGEGHRCTHCHFPVAGRQERNGNKVINGNAGTDTEQVFSIKN